MKFVISQRIIQKDMLDEKGTARVKKKEEFVNQRYIAVMQYSFVAKRYILAVAKVLKTLFISSNSALM